MNRNLLSATLVAPLALGAGPLPAATFSWLSQRFSPRRPRLVTTTPFFAMALMGMACKQTILNTRC